MKEIQLTQGQVALVDDEDFEYLSQWKWSALKCASGFYAIRRSGNKQILMHRLILGLNNLKINGDHEDRNSLNNQRYNLRVATRSQNNSNRSSRKNSSSKYLGVSWHKGESKWRAAIQKDRVIKFLGRFENEADAALVYNKAAIKIHGKFANLNKI